MSEGLRYQTLEEAWDDFYPILSGGKMIDSTTYHTLRKSFLCGAVASLNVATSRMADPVRSSPENVFISLMSTLTESMQLLSKEMEEGK